MNWLDVGFKTFGVVFPVLTFQLGRAQKAGAATAALADCQKDIERQGGEIKLYKEALQSVRETLQSHVTLHRGYEAQFADIHDSLKENNRLLGYVCGRLGIEVKS